MMRWRWLVALLGLLFTCSISFTQSYSERYTNKGNQFILYDHGIGAGFKVHYFAHNANYYYQRWRGAERVNLICAGAFSESWELAAKPVGFTTSNGNVINARIDPTMDGLVMIRNGQLIIIDLDNMQSGFTAQNGNFIRFNPRVNLKDRVMLREVAEEENLTIFQSQLVYSEDKTHNFSNPYYGEKAERRFLALCSRSDGYHYVIIDAPTKNYLNLSANYAKQVLDYAGYTTHYMLNLDTGGKNILYVRDNSSLLRRKYGQELKDATNLIVFYK